MRMTAKQRCIMNVIMRGNTNDNGVTISWCDISELRERIPYGSSREAVLCSIKFLEKKGLLEVRPRAVIRNGRRKTLFIPTNLAFDMLTRKPMSEEEMLDLIGGV